MTYHVLHITTPNCYLSIDKGLLFCNFKDGEIKSIALDDIKVVVVAAFGVSFSNNCITRLLESDVVILHCNNSYEPIGWSVSTDRVIRTKVFYNQIAQNKDFENALWKKILKAKVINQYNCLKLMGIEDEAILKLINRPLINEANIAKKYWQNYFSNFDKKIKREKRGATDFENACLNYGYAIIKTLIYRSILAHGLISGLGIHHKEKYKSTPLVYDLMEPFRPFVDYYFLKFNGKTIAEWGRFLADCLKNYRLEVNGASYKMVDIVEIYVEKIAGSYLTFNLDEIFLPNILEQYLYIDKQRNRELEE